MEDHRKRLAAWRELVRAAKERDAEAWQAMRAAANIAPLARKTKPHPEEARTRVPPAARVPSRRPRGP